MNIWEESGELGLGVNDLKDLTNPKSKIKVTSIEQFKNEAIIAATYAKKAGYKVWFVKLGKKITEITDQDTNGVYRYHFISQQTKKRINT